MNWFFYSLICFIFVFIPYSFVSIHISKLFELYFLHQFLFYIYHRFSHQMFFFHKKSIHKYHHMNKKFHNIIEPIGFFLYAIVDQIVPFILYSYNYCHIIFYFSFIDHIIVHSLLHIFKEKNHIMHHKLPILYSYGLSNYIFDYLFNTLPQN